MRKNRRLALLIAALLTLVQVQAFAAGDVSVQAPQFFKQNGQLLVDQADGSAVFNARFHIAVATVNAGTTLLPAQAGYKYRMVSCKAIAVGGAAGAVTTVDILSTQATSSVKLVAFAQANLTQSTVLLDGGTGAAVLADGASYQPNDAGKAVTIGITGSSITTATFIDVILSYTLEK